MEIFLEGDVVDHAGQVDKYKKGVIEKLRELEKEYSKIEIWPKIGVSSVIRITANDSIYSADWERIKARAMAIVECDKNEEQMIRRGKELAEFQKAQEKLQKATLEYLGSSSERKYTLEEVAEAIEIPTYWKGFSKPQREVIVSQQLSQLVKLEKVEESGESKEFKQIYYYRLKSKE
ncbi:MAG: hypothetical protein QMD14_00835 [Candidatus Aenigmarchaeota archaeon]|nr:hypothetical protein [Candidatus Aenigmarchaeota archaeon]